MMLFVQVGACAAPLWLKTIVVGVSPARWAGLRNGRAVGARSGQLAAAAEEVKRVFLPSSPRGAGPGLLAFSGFGPRVSDFRPSPPACPYWHRGSWPQCWQAPARS